ncbi:MAG: hypothetical protein MOGMAGMI_01709 [Candidatus Omnitrophica bacterium]|nr:hypothetical protein [Candidatus Omnitrophota bacterium]
MNSCLYECVTRHDRMSPKRYGLKHRMFYALLDLDEIDGIARRSWWLGRRAAKWFSFDDRDHLWIGGADVRANIRLFLESKGVTCRTPRILLLTQLRTLGHYFNPVAFYFCYGEDGRPVCAVAEVSNTFHEMKPYLLGPDTYREGRFIDRQTKYFYISPFTDLDAELDFRLSIPGERLELHVDDLRGGERFFTASLTGVRRELTDRRLFWYAWRYLAQTLAVLGWIHWHALRLYLMRVPHRNKEDRPDLQREVTRERIVKNS